MSAARTVAAELREAIPYLVVALLLMLAGIVAVAWAGPLAAAFIVGPSSALGCLYGQRNMR